jgi:hypothetical protein
LQRRETTKTAATINENGTALRGKNNAIRAACLPLPFDRRDLSNRCGATWAHIAEQMNRSYIQQAACL